MVIFLLIFSAFMLGGGFGQYQARKEYEPILERLVASLEKLVEER